MPWCEPCGRFLSPNTLREDGTCPVCGEVVEPPTDADRRTKVPWHFWLLLAALAVYLGWRAIQGVEWLAAHL
jgi:hypothetical protein